MHNLLSILQFEFQATLPIYIIIANSNSNMFGGLENGTTYKRYWSELQIGFKYLVVATLAFGVVGIFTNLPAFLFSDVLVYTVNKFQIWRLVTSFLVDMSIINVIFNLYMLSMSLPEVEKMYSTAYAVFEVLLQSLACNLGFVCFGELMSAMGLVDSSALVNFGLSQLMLIFLWQRAAINPEELTRFCCLPCLMPMKYLPWCFCALIVLFGGSKSIIIGCLLGYYQHMMRKGSIIRLPMSVYYKIEALLPTATKNAAGFVSIRSVEENLRSVSRDRSDSSHQALNSSDVMNDRVDVIGGGVSIGSSSQANPLQNYKQHWIKEEEEAQKDAELKEPQDLPSSNESSEASSRNLLKSDLI